MDWSRYFVAPYSATNTHSLSHFSILQNSLIILSNLFLSTGINLGPRLSPTFNDDDVLLHFAHLPSKLHYIFSLQQQLKELETWGGNNCWLTKVSWCPYVMAMSVILTCCHVLKWHQHLQQSPHLFPHLCQVLNLSTHRSCHREPMPGPGTCFLANQRSVRAVQFAYSSDPDTRRQSADLCGGLRRKLIGYCVFNFCLFLLDFNYRRLFWYSR